MPMAGHIAWKSDFESYLKDFDLVQPRSDEDLAMRAIGEQVPTYRRYEPNLKLRFDCG